MSIPPPGWHSHYLDDEADRREARLDASRFRRFMAGVVRALLILLVIAIVMGFILFVLGGYMDAIIVGIE